MNLDGSTGGQEERMIVLLVKTFSCVSTVGKKKTVMVIYTVVVLKWCQSTYMYSILDSLDRFSNITIFSS